MVRIKPKPNFVIGVIIFQPPHHIDEVRQNPFAVWPGTFGPIAPTEDRNLGDIRHIGNVRPFRPPIDSISEMVLAIAVEVIVPFQSGSVECSDANRQLLSQPSPVPYVFVQDRHKSP